jgi:hypothetical protein
MYLPERLNVVVSVKTSLAKTTGQMCPNTLQDIMLISLGMSSG